jgi:RNA polymerase sigma-70 factor (ECF subfamily)
MSLDAIPDDPHTDDDPRIEYDSGCGSGRACVDGGRTAVHVSSDPLPMTPLNGTTVRLRELLGGEDRLDREALLGVAAARMTRIARKMLAGYPHLRRWEQTDDVFQQAALRLYRSLADVRPESVRAFWGLAATQIRRTLVDLLRHHFGPQGAASHENVSQLQFDNVPEATSDAFTLAEWEAFHEAVGQLPEDEREAFQLIFYGDATYAQAATVLGVSERTVLRRVLVARRLLAEAVREPDGSDR